MADITPLNQRATCASALPTTTRCVGDPFIEKQPDFVNSTLQFIKKCIFLHKKRTFLRKNLRMSKIFCTFALS